MTAVLVLTGSENVLVFGGRTPSCLALGDCYLLNLETRMWKKVTTSEQLFSSLGIRHTKLKLARKVLGCASKSKERKIPLVLINHPFQEATLLSYQDNKYKPGIS